MYFFFNDTATTEIYTYGHTLSLHDALPICLAVRQASEAPCRARPASGRCGGPASTPVSTATAIRCLRKWRKTTILGKARRGAVGSPSRRMAEKLDDRSEERRVGKEGGSPCR